MLNCSLCNGSAGAITGHAATVIGVDLKMGIVYVNDSSMTNDGVSVYDLTIVSKKAPATGVAAADVSAA